MVGSCLLVEMGAEKVITHLKAVELILWTNEYVAGMKEEGFK